MPSDSIIVPTDAGDQFATSGFAFVRGAQVISELPSSYGKESAKGIWAALPADPYQVGADVTRYRRHGTLSLNASASAIEWHPPTTYYQGVEFNPIFGGIERRFAPIILGGFTRKVIEPLVHFGASRIFRLDGNWLVNVHLVRTVSIRGAGVPPAPEGLHRDGYECISIHLVDRNNEFGGETLLQPLNGRAATTITMTDHLDSLFVNDPDFKHDVSPIASTNRDCYRDMILMSFESSQA